MIRDILCDTCGRASFSPVLKKKSSRDEEFTVVKCRNCGLVQVNPQPDFADVAKYYSNEYFTQRTDRGYDNYYSDKIRSEIERVFQLNLRDLKFNEWEEKLPEKGRTIDIGCAAGYFVKFMEGKGWNSEGIEIAEGPVKFGREALGLTIHQEDFLSWDENFENKFDLVTLWASIEHLHRPRNTVEKIYRHLKPGGRMILSTCRYGTLAKLKGAGWRFLNVPEHLYYYSLEGLRKLSENAGFKYVSHISYGSGMTAKKNSGAVYNIMKKILDKAVKIFDEGDMMALQFEKPPEAS